MTEYNLVIVAGSMLIIGLLVGYIVSAWRNKNILASVQAEALAANMTLEQKEQSIDGLAKDLQEQRERSDEILVDKNDADQKLAKALADVEGLKTRISERDQQIELKRMEMETVNQKADDLSSSNSNIKEQSKAFQVSAERLQTQLDELKEAQTLKEANYKSLSDRYTSLSNEHAELKTTLSEKLANFEEQQEAFKKTKEQLKIEFQNLANQILEEKGKVFSQANQSSLDAMLKPFKEQIEAFQKRVNDVHSESVKGNASLESEIKKILDIGVKMSDEANNLTTALKGEKKTAGNWGEIQLERTLQLSGLVSGDHYEYQDKFKDDEGKTKFPDFIVKLPDDKHMVIDSKVSLVAYDRAVSAETDIETKKALDDHVQAVRNHIDDLYKKDYSNLIGMRSPNFVLMFMPIESAYIEAMRHKRDLFTYGYDKNVILVSHTTLMPILRTVANLWRIERGNEEAREISEKAGDIFSQVCTVAERLDKLGRSLNAVSNHYNSTVKGLVGQQGLYGKVERFSSLSSKVVKKMPILEPLHADFEHQRLELIVEPAQENAAEGKSMTKDASSNQDNVLREHGAQEKQL